MKPDCRGPCASNLGCPGEKKFFHFFCKVSGWAPYELGSDFFRLSFPDFLSEPP
jgi:hypothetical protein